MASSTHAASDVGHDNHDTVLVVAHGEHNSMQHVFKGKNARSWQQLPGEIVRLIATYYLLDASATGYCPNAWEPRDLWPQRFAFTTIRDALEVERVMQLFPSWKCHLEDHSFWSKACALLDPMCSYNYHLTVIHPTAGSQGAVVQRISMHRHYRSMLDVSCAVCRVNYPFNSEGLCAGSVKRSVNTPILGIISLCKEHRKTAAFCGICLREAPRGEFEDDYPQGLGIACAENEDEETWPGVDATCRACRNEGFWRRVNMRREWQEAVDNRRWAMLDWETKQSVESFIDMGEGSIRDVLQVAEEKHWLRKYTKLGDMLQQALAASRYASRAEAGEAYASDEELSDEDMDDPEMLSLTEDAGGIKDLALNDWARNRILDGHWITPADEWFGNFNHARPRLAPAVHPCPWNRRAVYEGALDDGQGDEAQELQHPRPKTLVPHPPSFGLCEMTYRAFSRQMREILLPPMRNLVRKLVMESTADGTDPAIRAVRMSVEDLVSELRDESTWYNGIDWLERRANARLEADRQHAKDDDSSSSSSRSDGSHTTSPVLSTTTLQTTPSPPPTGKDDEVTVSSPLVSVASPVSPMMKAPELLRPIPYVPVTTEHLPQHSVEALLCVWREACAPLYQCQCSICERAMLNANMATATVPTQVQLATQIQQEQQPPPQLPQLQIKIQEAPIRMDDAEIEDDDDLDEYEDESEEGESERGDDTSISIPESPAPAFSVTPRKRSSSDLDAETESDAFSLTASTTTDGDPDQFECSERSRTPPKRMRREGSYDQTQVSPVAIAPPSLSSPLRQRKRSSEELDEDSGISPIAGKRLRADLMDRPPPSTLASAIPTPMGSSEKTAVVAAGATTN